MKMRNLKMKTLSRILLYILLIAIIFIIIYNVVYTFRIALNKENSINFLGIKSIVLDNNMMSPDLKKYDLVILKRYKNDNVKIGDIVAFYENSNRNNTDNFSKIKVTRVAQEEKYTNETYYLTKADNSYYYDKEKITQRELEGKVWFSIPLVGFIIKIAQSKIVTGLIFLGLVFLFVEIIRIHKRKVKRRENRIKEQNVVN